MYKFEQEAVNKWNPFGTWTPSELNPRCGYHYVLLGQNYQLGFDVFTIAFPLRFRERFSALSQDAHDLL